MPFLQDPLKPSIFFLEVTYPDQWEERARNQGHLCPAVLREELTAVQAEGLPIPHIVVVHMNPRYEEAIVKELADLSAELGVEITPATEGVEFQV